MRNDLRWLAFLSMTLFASRLCADEEPQLHEVNVTVDISVQTQANASLIDAQYTFTPEALNRVDDVVPILRRFVRHPSAVWLRIVRNGSTVDTQTSGRAGGILQLFGGRLYASGEIGVELDGILYDPLEDGYWAAPMRLELGGRPTGLVSLGAFIEARPVISANINETTYLPTTRSGGGQTIGGTLSVATENDRLFFSLSGGWENTEWDFSPPYQGPITFDGLVSTGRVIYQMSPTFSFGFTADFKREHWVDGRFGDNDTNRIGPNIDRIVYTAVGAFDITYWHKGRYGFRFMLGGGFAGAKPLLNDVDRALTNFGFGLVSRF